MPLGSRDRTFFTPRHGIPASVIRLELPRRRRRFTRAGSGSSRAEGGKARCAAALQWQAQGGSVGWWGFATSGRPPSMACLNGAAGNRRNRASSASRSLTYLAGRSRRRLPSPRREPQAAPTAVAPLAPARTPTTTGASSQTTWASFTWSARSAGSGSSEPGTVPTERERAGATGRRVSGGASACCKAPAKSVLSPPAVWWFAVFSAVPFTFSVGFCAGTVWRSRAYARSLEAILTDEVIRAGFQLVPRHAAADDTCVDLPPHLLSHN